MSDDEVRPLWLRHFESHLTKLTRPGLGFRKAALLWVSAFAIVVVACAVFFLTLFWVFK